MARLRAGSCTREPHGVTGERDVIAEEAAPLGGAQGPDRRAVVLGFGLSTPEREAAAAVADGAGGSAWSVLEEHPQGGVGVRCDG